MADEPPPCQTPINPYDFLSVTHNSDDGTLTRPQIPISGTSAEFENDQVITKDIPLNTAHKTLLRLFLPHSLANTTSDKLPLILYFRAGGFILCSAANTVFHNFCTSLATNLPALIISLDHRLAPENRLPAAYDDALEAINWVRNQALDVNGDQWLREFGDFSKCYLMGCSSGGNIAYHAGLHAKELDMQPLKIKGLILNQPFFGSVKRTESELRSVDDKILPLAASDLMWELSLPRGADRDHEYCNAMVGDRKDKIGMIQNYFVSVRRGDPLMDHQIEFVRMLERNGGCVVVWNEKGYHGMELFEPQSAEVLFVAIANFLSSVGNIV